MRLTASQAKFVEMLGYTEPNTREKSVRLDEVYKVNFHRHPIATISLLSPRCRARVIKIAS